MRKLTQFQEVLENSILLSEYSLDNHKFCSKDDALMFVNDGKLYAIPWNSQVLSILEKAGFKRTKMKIKNLSLYSSYNYHTWEFLDKKINS